ncbi:MAG: sugar transferase [Desulfohalobiaceae bacterium]|nr:sugar transferase [Desulfohalobiaceae bacterium]
MFQQLSHRNEDLLLTLGVHLLDTLVVICLIPILSILYAVPWRPSYTNLCIFVFCLSNILLYAVRMYQPWRGQNITEELSNILKTWAVLLGFVFLALFVTKTSYNFSRRILLTWGVIGPGALYLVHVLVRYWLRFVQHRGVFIKNAVIVGAGELGRSLESYLEQIPWSGIRLQGYFDDSKAGTKLHASSKPLLGRINDLKTYLAMHPVDYVFIALPFRAQARINQVLSTIRTSGAHILLIPDLSAFRMYNAELQTLGDMVLVNFNPDQTLKRIFDLLFSALTLIVFSPLFAMIALLIKLEDRGPIFFRHKRVTMAGRTFQCLKFRTMQVDAEARLREIVENDPASRQEWNKHFKLKNDPRVTRIGKILRRTSLDELPQFFNVLKGEMSVVGVRPIVEKEMAEYYQEQGGLYCSIKPGITGAWQVDKRSDVENYAERIRLDTMYILNRNLLFDLRIICKTIVKILTGKGAY